MMADNPLPKTVLEAPSLEEAAKRLGDFLERGAPTPMDATARAIDDPLYARALHASRKMPGVVAQLLFAPDSISLSASPDSDAPTAKPAEARSQPSAAQLIGKAAGATLKWGMSGLKQAEPWRISQRLAACAACEHQVPAPDTLLYRGAKVAVGPDAKICAQCHCLTNTKAALMMEKCPEQDPQDPSLSRWGEPWVPVEEHEKGPW